MEKMSKTADEEMQKLWEQATPEQKYIIVRFMRNIVKPEKTPGANHRFGRLDLFCWHFRIIFLAGLCVIIPSNITGFV